MMPVHLVSPLSFIADAIRQMEESEERMLKEIAYFESKIEELKSRVAALRTNRTEYAAALKAMSPPLMEAALSLYREGQPAMAADKGMASDCRPF